MEAPFAPFAKTISPHQRRRGGCAVHWRDLHRGAICHQIFFKSKNVSMRDGALSRLPRAGLIALAEAGAAPPRGRPSQRAPRPRGRADAHLRRPISQAETKAVNACSVSSRAANNCNIFSPLGASLEGLGSSTSRQEGSCLGTLACPPCSLLPADDGRTVRLACRP